MRGLDPRSLRDQALAALLAYLQALAAKGGALPVLIVEDLHWADDSSLDLLQHLLAHAAELPLALVMTGRPALLTRRPDWGMPNSNVQLTPLVAAQSSELAQALLQRMDEVPPKLTELIVRQAEDNPYYMEELVRRLVDDGVIAVDSATASTHDVPRWTLRQSCLPGQRHRPRLLGRRAAGRGRPGAASPASAARAAFVKAHDTSDFDGTTERQFDHHLLHQVT